MASCLPPWTQVSALPSSLAGMSELRTLLLGHNQLRALPSNLGDLCRMEVGACCTARSLIHALG